MPCSALQLDARQITAAIKDCRVCGDLARILQKQKLVLNYIHVSAAWVCVAKIGGGRGGSDLLEVVPSLQDRTRDVLKEMGGREVANALHSMAKLHKRGVTADPGLVVAMKSRATATAGQFIPQNVANLLWALATMGESAGRGLLAAMQRRAIATAGQFLPQNIANLSWALAKMGVRADPELLEAMQKRATATAGEFKPQEVANLLWALATMGETAARGLLEAMQRRSTETAGEFKPQEVANVLWALATMGERADRGLLQAMQRRATATAGEFSPQEVANVLWALATVGEGAGHGLLEAMQRRATATAGDFNPQNVANVLWALAAVGGGADGSLLVLMERLADRVLELRHQFMQAEKSQVHQWLLSCDLELVSGASLHSGVARVKQEMGTECLQAFSGQATSESRLQRDVAAALMSAGLKVEIEEEFRDARSGYSIDVLVRRRSAAGSAEWAVEVDGPFHFLGDGRTPSGSTLV